jgi:hypothetical protein
MTETVVAATPLASSGARLKGNALGATVCALFGSAWMFWTAAFVRTGRTAALVVVTVMTILICAWAFSSRSTL